MKNDKSEGREADNESFILVVDDEYLLVKRLYRLYYRDIKDWKFSFAKNGIVALEMIADGDFQLMITDISMPEMDGVTLLRHIKDSGKRIVSVVVTAYGDSFQEQLLEIEPFRILPKPVDFELLTIAIKQGLDEYGRLELENGD